MSKVLVLDSSALDALIRRRPGHSSARASVEAAERLGRDVVVPTLVLAEWYRTRSTSQAIDALLARAGGIRLRDTDRTLARLVGGLLSAAGVGSEAIVDAHVVAAAVDAGGGVCLTGDAKDLERLSAGAASVVVVGLDDSPATGA